jgi:UDP-N-acetylglucosamine acyltransferase
MTSPSIKQANDPMRSPVPSAGEIHPTAIIYEGAVIGEGSSIGPYSVIGPQVVLGKNCRIGPHVVIEGNTTLGDFCQIFQFASVGSAPQDQKWEGTDTRLEIGDNNIIREYATIQPGVEQFGGLTSVGNNNLFMASSHVGHDCQIGDNNYFTNSSALAGHITVGNFCIVGGLAAIHQFSRLGDHCFLGGGTMASMDIPPFCVAQGDRAGLVKINDVGLLRRGYSEADVKTLQKIFRKLFYGEGLFKDRVVALKAEYKDFEPGQEFFTFIETSERGITPLRRKKAG